MVPWSEAQPSTGKTLFMGTAVIGLILMMAVTTMIWWFISPRLHEISSPLAVGLLTILRLFFLTVSVGMVLVLLTCYLERNFLIAKFAVRVALWAVFPLTMLLGLMFGVQVDRMRESYVHVNNAFVRAARQKYSPERTLILLPHCLQYSECGVRITIHIENCKQCGQCDIGFLRQLATERKIPIAIATGGTLARKIIVENKPELIIAIACPRDLVDGMRDVFPIPVYGVLNRRPNGPCFNTKVVMEDVRKVVESLISTG